MADKSRLLRQAVWEAWLRAVTSAEHELQRATTRLREAVGLEANGHPLGPELMAQLRKQREEFERKLDEGVHAAMARVRAPIDRELERLRARLEAVQSRTENLRNRKSR